ncbi:MAG: carotenoid biosynthesis protein [Leptolyngbya sp. SIO4C1]|nr:carotenoid biosynthesis protein [Leptolyngbya sp. SIO4C1]
MNQLAQTTQAFLWSHILAMFFGLAGLLWVMPHPEWLAAVPAGTQLFRWSMAGGGVIYIVLGAIAVALYAAHHLGYKALIIFSLAAIGISLTSELLGTSTGFPFGHYSYLNGLGYKIAGLVPFTIPLSWFYLGLSAYCLARGALVSSPRQWLRQGLAVVLGAGLLTAWDFVLDPAMSQTALPFWYWHQPGAFFGMPYQNFWGWLGTGIVFMGVAAFGWRRLPSTYGLSRSQLSFWLWMYLANFGFALVMSLSAGFGRLALLGLTVGVMPALLCWWQTPAEPSAETASALAAER